MFEENIDPGFRILFLRPLQLDHLINSKKVLHDDYIQIISNDAPHFTCMHESENIVAKTLKLFLRNVY